MLGTFTKLPKDIFPSENFPTVQFPKRQLPKSVLAAALDPLVLPSRGARSPWPVLAIVIGPPLQPVAPQKAKPNL